MKKHLILFSLTVTLFLSFVSCEETSKQDTYIPIKSVRAIASTSLNERGDWNFHVNQNIYRSTVNGRTIHALPNSEKEAAYFIVDPDGKVSTSTISNMANVLMLFVSPQYPLLKKKTPEEKVLNRATTNELLDQSTYAKMLTMDALSVNHSSIATPHIENVKLEHSHCLIDYTFDELPEGAQVSLLTSGIKMKPFVDDELYVAILINPQLASVQVTVGEEVHEVSLESYIKKLPIEMRSLKDMRYSFEVKYNAQTDNDGEVLTIENLVARKWGVSELAIGK